MRMKPDARLAFYQTKVSTDTFVATTNTIMQWPWTETHASITRALFADVINRAVEDQRNGIANKPMIEVSAV
jgi:hypothetical protein